jgi:hypothetical protein
LHGDTRSFFLTEYTKAKALPFTNTLAQIRNESENKRAFGLLLTADRWFVAPQLQKGRDAKE